MGRVKAEVTVSALASVAEELWYDTSRWPTFVDGLAHVEKVEGDWPHSGRVLWDAKVDGRGRVDERVVSHEARTGQTLAIEDEKLTGTQTIEFHPTDDGCRIVLTLSYKLKMDPPTRQVIDFFARRPLKDSLRRTLRRFQQELEFAPESLV
ncbi:SRPBCC family protein [Conexibacter woesei]|uniref:SRPBCC family protein n=1 Tax=Conexibacter woesei TaxID=191495 RepID=UPI00040A6ABB|nr:SRPBCC family protein [Conexibacter woesei]